MSYNPSTGSAITRHNLGEPQNPDLTSIEDNTPGAALPIDYNSYHMYYGFACLTACRSIIN
jgi:hypothetical protein